MNTFQRLSGRNGHLAAIMARYSEARGAGAGEWDKQVNRQQIRLDLHRQSPPLPVFFFWRAGSPAIDKKS